MIDINANDLLAIIDAYGYWAVLFLVAIESMGVPVPGETILLAASVYAGTTHRLTIVLVIAAAVLGAILGDNLGFLIGRAGGHRLLHRYGSYVHLDDRRLQMGEHLFACHGGKVVFFGRFVGFLRMWAAFLAGAHRMPWDRFLAFNAAGAVAWATLMGTFAYVFGQTVLQMGTTVGIVSGAVGLLLMAAVTVALQRSERRWQQESLCNEAVQRAA